MVDERVRAGMSSSRSASSSSSHSLSSWIIDVVSEFCRKICVLNFIIVQRIEKKGKNGPYSTENVRAILLSSKGAGNVICVELYVDYDDLGHASDDSGRELQNEGGEDVWESGEGGREREGRKHLGSVEFLLPLTLSKVDLRRTCHGLK